MNSTSLPSALDTSKAVYAVELWFQGVLLTSVAYGTTIVLCLQCISMLFSGLNRVRIKREFPLLVYVILVFVLATIDQGASMYIAMGGFVNNPNELGGPAAYEQTHFSLRINALANSMLLILCFLSDALLLWRCTVVYQGTWAPVWFTRTFAGVVWLAEFLIGALFLAQLTEPTQTLWSAINFNLSFFSLSLAVNITSTLLIVGRISLCRFRVWQILKCVPESAYLGVMAMVVESELLYTAFLIPYIALLHLDSPALVIFEQPIGFVQTTAALMIVYRVAQGKAWSKDTYDQYMTSTGNLDAATMQFADISDVQNDKSHANDIEVENLKVEPLICASRSTVEQEV
ncbi:hypothetical protein EIP86_001754 [Pleurotus ostreatoroseus]|nr:hypothetical protein EIP86_001754 [Pleurotus ostreatoroseus]